MLTLVAAVLAYDIALDICDLRSSIVEEEVEAFPRIVRRSSLASLNERSCTREENDMMGIVVRKWVESGIWSEWFGVVGS